MIAAKCSLQHLRTEAIRSQATTNCICFEYILNLEPIAATVTTPSKIYSLEFLH